MPWDSTFKPQLRAIEAFPLRDGDVEMVGLRDPGGLSDVVLTLSAAALHILTTMDGAHTCEQIQEKFRAAWGQCLSDATLASMLDNLERVHFLDGPGFEAYYGSLLEAYRGKTARETTPRSPLAVFEDVASLFEEMLAEAEPVSLPGPVIGLVAPHLDYPRGRPCYAAAYAALRERAKPDRVIILGTNHFGRSAAVVATAKDFETPLGVTRTDVAFLERLERRCGSLRTYELDHVPEHSVELQLTLLQHLFGSDSFEIVPFLCPDPCGPTETMPYDGRGVDLREFAVELGSLAAGDERDTLVVAGADLSHVGAQFGDERTLDAEFLDEVHRRDKEVLRHLEGNIPEMWRKAIAEDENSTRVCSAGCIFALATALPGATGTILKYHQAVDQPPGTCVTCAAVAFT